MLESKIILIRSSLIAISACKISKTLPACFHIFLIHAVWMVYIWITIGPLSLYYSISLNQSLFSVQYHWTSLFFSTVPLNQSLVFLLYILSSFLSLYCTSDPISCLCIVPLIQAVSCLCTVPLNQFLVSVLYLWTSLLSLSLMYLWISPLYLYCISEPFYFQCTVSLNKSLVSCLCTVPLIQAVSCLCSVSLTQISVSVLYLLCPLSPGPWRRLCWCLGCPAPGSISCSLLGKIYNCQHLRSVF